MKVVTPKTTDGCSPTLTTRFENVGATNLVSVAHFPLGGGDIFRACGMKKVINPSGGGDFSMPQNHVLQGIACQLSA